MKYTKAMAMAKAASLNVEVEDFTSPRSGRRHIHLYSPTGFIFYSTGCHNAGAHDGEEPVNWKQVANEMDLQPCPEHGHGCEVCDETAEE